MNRSDVTIIGAGAAGMMAAITAAKRGRKVTLLEHLPKALKKILSTGNGKCNFTNRHYDDDSYRGTDPSFANEALKIFDCEAAIAFFENLGVRSYDRLGYMYPATEQASAIRTALIAAAEALEVNIITDVSVDDIAKKDDSFTIVYHENEAKGKTLKLVSDSLILATGGKAAPVHGSDGSGYRFAKGLGHHCTELWPALTSISIDLDEKIQKKLHGVRCRCEASLFCNEELISRQSGEIIFSQGGLSGIPILQLSRYASSHNSPEKKLRISLDFVPEMNESSLLDYLKEIKLRRFSSSCFDCFDGLVSFKLASELMLRAGMKGNSLACEVTDKSLKTFADLLKAFSIKVTGCGDFNVAQVTAGGICTDEINVQTMESRLTKGLYLVGELLDIDGTCGGYNLQFAWSTGYIAGSNA